MEAAFLTALPVIRKIEEAGFEAYFVGGAVRDHFLNRSIHDVDIATSATPLEIKAIFKATVDIGIEHGTVLVLMNNSSFEVTTFRTESDYIDFRHPQTVTFVRSLTEDLKRRDFTMNAIAMDRHFRIIDPFEGKKALENQIIETVGAASERFTEDALRLMRAIRFVSQLGFNLEVHTEKELSLHGHLLKQIAVERIYAEMTKMLDGDFKTLGFQLILKTELYKYLPAIFSEKEIVQSLITLKIEPLRELEMWILGLFLHTSTLPANDLKIWKLPKQKIKFILRALQWLKWRMENNWTNEQYYFAGKDSVIVVERIYATIHHQSLHDIAEQVEEQFGKLPIMSRQDLQVSGNDLLQWMKKPAGPWVKKVLEAVEKAILNEQLPNEKSEIRRWVDTCQLLLEKK